MIIGKSYVLDQLFRYSVLKKEKLLHLYIPSIEDNSQMRAQQMNISEFRMGKNILAINPRNI